MKGRNWLIWILAVCLLTGCCYALAEDWPPEGKVEAFYCLGPEDLDQVYYSRNSYSLDEYSSVGREIILFGSGGATEERATSVQITFMNGDEALKDLFAFENGIVWIHTPDAGVTGRATFRIRAESSKLYVEKEIHPEVRILDTSKIHFEPFTYQVGINQDYDILEMIKSDLSRQGIPCLYVRYDMKDPEITTEEYIMNFSAFTALQEGEWLLNVEVDLDPAGTSAIVPLVLYTGETIQSETLARLDEYREKGTVSTDVEEVSETESRAAEEETPEAGDVTADAETPDSSDQGAGEESGEEEKGTSIRIGISEDYQFADHFDPAYLEELPLELHREMGIEYYLPAEATERNLVYRDKKIYDIADGMTAILFFSWARVEPLEDEQLRLERLEEQGAIFMHNNFTLDSGLPTFEIDYEWKWHPCTINGMEGVWANFSGGFSPRAVMVFEHDGYVYRAAYIGGTLLNTTYNDLMDIFFTSMAPRSDGVVPEEDAERIEGVHIGGMTEGAEFYRQQLGEGFSIGVPGGETRLGRWYTKKDDYAELPITFLEVGNWNYAAIIPYLDDENQYYENSQKAQNFYEKDWLDPKYGWMNTEYRYVDVNGHPALVSTYQVYNDQGLSDRGRIVYVRNNALLQLVVQYPSGNNRLTLDELAMLAELIEYDETQASSREADVSLTVASENNADWAAAGGKLKFTAEFANPEVVNEKAKNNKVTWFVREPSGEDSPDAAINASGILKVKNNLTEKKTVGVIAYSDKFGTWAYKEITLYPQIKAIHAEPETISLYLVDGAEEIISASLEPEEIPLDGLTWKVSPPNVLELENREDGTAAIRPLKAGKATVTVSSGGKTAKVTVQVRQPAEALEITWKGKAAAGKTISLQGKISPANATDKSLSWSVDVDESIAAISPKGQLKIQKDVPAGTKITVTCSAEGAPVPVTAVAEITVE